MYDDDEAMTMDRVLDGLAGGASLALLIGAAWAAMWAAAGAL